MKIKEVYNKEYECKQFQVDFKFSDSFYENLKKILEDEKGLRVVSNLSIDEDIIDESSENWLCGSDIFDMINSDKVIKNLFYNTNY